MSCLTCTTYRLKQIKMSIVIIGSSYGGTIAFQSIISEIVASGNKSKFSVTLVSKSSHIYANPAAPRLIVEPEHLDKVFFPVDKYVEKRSNGVKTTFVHENVEKADFDAKTLKLTSGKTLPYDYLVVASGTRAENAAFKLDGDYSESKEAIQKIHDTVKEVSSIAILGGGATGVEIASEIAYSFPKKIVTLFTGANGPLSAIGKEAAATKKLEELGVKIVNNKRFTSIETTDSGASSISFKDGTSETFDYYIPTYGVYPNSSFIETKYLDDDGYIIVDENLVVKGQNNVIAFGDVANITENTVVDIKLLQAKTFTHSVKKYFFKSEVALAPYKRVKRTTLIPISRKGGVGIIYGWSVPNFVVRKLKAADYMISKAGDDFT